MNKSQLKLKSPHKKNYENKAANEWTWNCFSCKQQLTTSDCTTWVYNLKCKIKLSTEAGNGGVL